MWGLAGWTGSNDAETLESLQLAVDLGCNFFDTALAYGDGKSEQLLGRLVKANADKTLYVATKIPPKNRIWPSRRGFRLEDVFPPAHIRASAEASLRNLNRGHIDLLQFHVWEDEWAGSTSWRRVIADLKRDGLVRAVGVSINRWEPANAIRAICTGLIDSVQVIYNLFDQAPEDELFPLCRQLEVAVIARVPFDEGSLTGTLRRDSAWPSGDWRNTYFVPENLRQTMDHVDRLQRDVPEGMTLPELAIRFILSNADVDVVIPGMRKPANVRANIAASDAGALRVETVARMRAHRWDRSPTAWSQ